eukprot:m.35594 g.35594  ORF g.35594 m.35594 type:complete len:355 (+) comp8905_c0_seq2:238-1302(+)
MADPQQYREAADYIREADRVLIVAAAGLSIHDTLPNNPYHNPKDFAYQYPRLTEYGYRTAYETMGLAGDESVPQGVRVAFMAKHFLNMRRRYPPTDGYSNLLEMTKHLPKENVFCWTSNVDGCFERSGFDPEQIYTSQGDMKRLQCKGKGGNPGCGNVWDATEQLEKVDANSPNIELQDMSLAPKCPNCGGSYMPNLRGGDWFIHKPYENISKRLMQWLDDAVRSKAKVVVVEVGIGRNTPIVSKIPAGYFASAVAINGGDVKYIRINPDPNNGREHQAPYSLQSGQDFVYFQSGWQVLRKIYEEFKTKTRSTASPAPVNVNANLEQPVHADASELQEEYKKILHSLWTPRHRR